MSSGERGFVTLYVAAVLPVLLVVVLAMYPVEEYATSIMRLHSENPSILYLWRLALLSFIAWIIALIFYLAKPCYEALSALASSCVLHVVSHYVYLLKLSTMTNVTIAVVVHFVGGVPELDLAPLIALVTCVVIRMHLVEAAAKGEGEGQNVTGE